MRRYFPDLEHFLETTQHADVIPVYRQLLADRLTPVSAFEVLGSDNHAFLLESVIGGEQVARYSFIATNPSLDLPGAMRVERRSHRTARRIKRLQRAIRWRTSKGCFRLADIITTRNCRPSPAGSSAMRATTRSAITRARSSSSAEGRPAAAGPAVRAVRRAGRLRSRRQDDQGGRQRRRRRSSTAMPHAAYRDACRRIDAIVERLQQPPVLSLGEIDPRSDLTLTFESNFTQPRVRGRRPAKGKEYIKAGDIFQFVPSQRLRVKSDGRSVRRLPRAADHQPVAVHVLPEDAGVHADRLEPGDSVPRGGRRR